MIILATNPIASLYTRQLTFHTKPTTAEQLNSVTKHFELAVKIHCCVKTAEKGWSEVFILESEEGSKYDEKKKPVRGEV